MKHIEWINIIKAVAEEQGFSIDAGKKQFSIDKDIWHTVSFLVKKNSAGYLQVQQWEGENETEGGIWGRSVYSLRSLTDVIHFCTIIELSSKIHARR
ncbi:MAG: hypothetical protein D3923_19945 [Candidatus Electrothrix sp. AR3]|nr:hypothetical protein [Candidatus Electrothrix sp. AR3]